MPQRSNNKRFLRQQPDKQTGTRARPSRRRLRKKRPGKQRGSAVKGAQNSLKQFRQASILAVAVTGLLLILLTPGEAGLQQDDNDTTVVEQNEDSVAIIEEVVIDDLVEEEEAEAETDEETDSSGPLGKAATDEAISTLRNLWEGFYSNLPKILVAIGALFLAWLFSKLFRFLLGKTIGHWESSGAVITLVVIAVWLFSIGVALSVVAGDIRALVGSLGLIGLALSWSLQTPIESFTGWLLNSFQRYYRVGDRISVGEVFGDVYRIDFLTTTVWEIGAPYRAGFVQAEQPTGRLVTFPNNEILSGTVVNLTGDFPFVWDELAVGVANESDVKYAMEVLEKIATELLGDYMVEPARRYSHILKRAGLHDSVPEKPQVFISMDESWTDIIIRYLVGARERRKWKSELSLRITEELNKNEYADKIISVYPRQQIQFINPEGSPIEINDFQKEYNKNKAGKKI
ncbi:MAG: mechanosensitive ion channel family protein [Bacteroidota bacterium]|nr:mechanosensitive ion channel family protein [Bacteroidota bacterium]